MSMGATVRSSRSSSHQNFARAEAIDPYHEGRQYQYEEMHDAPPRRRGRWRRRLTVLTLIAIGTYAYRSYYVKSASTQTPPLITAAETPSKVTPATSDRQSGKLIQERVGALGSGERMASREEQSVAPKSTESTPRGAWALPPASNQLPPQGTASAPDSISSDQKRVTTLTIRPDRTEAGPPPSASASAAPSQPRPAQPAARGTPASDSAPAQPTQRALTPPAPRMAATPPAAAAASAAAGEYVVQVSSQRSEADAQASFRSLQEKFPSQLGGRTAIVRRADLGAKGIYYRALAGPFASAGDADQFCSSLKAAGGQCIIHRN